MDFKASLLTNAIGIFMIQITYIAPHYAHRGYFVITSIQNYWKNVLNDLNIFFLKLYENINKFRYIMFYLNLLLVL